MLETIFRNLPGHPNWEGSFYEQLTEHGSWNMDEFWKLNVDLTEVARAFGTLSTMDREIALAVVTLQDKVLAELSARASSPDCHKIVGLTSDQLLDLTERFRLSILSVFGGEIVPETSFDLPNPYLQCS